MAQDSLPSPIYVIRHLVIIYNFTETILIVLVDKYLTRPTMPLVQCFVDWNSTLHVFTFLTKRSSAHVVRSRHSSHCDILLCNDLHI